MTELTIPNESTSVEYTVGSTPSTGPFTIPFSFFDTDDVRVSTQDADGVLTEFVNVTDFVVTPTAVDGGYDGGSLVMNVAVSDVTLKVYRSTVIDRENNFATTGPFDFDLLNNELNKIIAICQELASETNEIISLTPGSQSDTPWDLHGRAAGNAGESESDSALVTNRQMDASGPNWLADTDVAFAVGAAEQWQNIFSQSGIVIEGNDTTRFFDLMTQFFGFIQNRNANEALFYVRYRYQVDCYAQVTKQASNVYQVKVPGVSAIPFSFMDIEQDIDYTNGNCTVTVALDIYPNGVDSGNLWVEWTNIAVNTSEPR